MVLILGSCRCLVAVRSWYYAEMMGWRIVILQLLSRTSVWFSFSRLHGLLIYIAFLLRHRRSIVMSRCLACNSEICNITLCLSVGWHFYWLEERSRSVSSFRCSALFCQCLSFCFSSCTISREITPFLGLSIMMPLTFWNVWFWGFLCDTAKSSDILDGTLCHVPRKVITWLETHIFIVAFVPSYYPQSSPPRRLLSPSKLK